MRLSGVLIGVPPPLRLADQRGIVFSVRCRSGVSGPRIRSHGDGFGSGEHSGCLSR